MNASGRRPSPSRSRPASSGESVAVTVPAYAPSCSRRVVRATSATAASRPGLRRGRAPRTRGGVPPSVRSTAFTHTRRRGTNSEVSSPPTTSIANEQHPALGRVAVDVERDEALDARRESFDAARRRVLEGDRAEPSGSSRSRPASAGARGVGAVPPASWVMLVGVERVAPTAACRRRGRGRPCRRAG